MFYKKANVLLLGVFWIILLIVPFVAVAQAPKKSTSLGLVVEYPALSCENKPFYSKVKTALEESCSQLGENLMVGKGPWGFGIFNKTECRFGASDSKQKMAEGSWLLRLEVERSYLVFTLLQVSKTVGSAKPKAVAISRFMTSPHSLRLLSDAKFMRLIAAELLDQMPTQGQVPINASPEEQEASDAFPKQDDSMGALSIHSPSDQWILSQIEYDAKTKKWKAGGKVAAGRGDSPYTNSQWWVNKKGRGTRLKEIKQMRTEMFLKLLDAYETEASPKKTDKKAGTKIVKSDEGELACLVTSASISQESADMDLEGLTPGQSVFRRSHIALLGGANFSFLNKNVAAQMMSVRLMPFPSWLPGFSIEAGTAKSDYSFTTPEDLNNAPLTVAVTDKMLVKYDKRWMSLGVTLERYLSFMTVFAQARWSYVDYRIVFDEVAKSKDVGFKDDEQKLWGVIGGKIGVEYFNPYFSCRVSGKYTSNVTDPEKLQEFGGQVELDYNLVQNLDFLNKIFKDFRLVALGGLEVQQIVEHSINSDDFESRFRLPIPVPVLGGGLIVAW